MKILLIDQDNVLADWQSYFLDRLHTRFSDIPRQEIKSFRMMDNYAEEYHEAIQTILDEPDYYLSLSPLPKIRNSLNKLSNHFNVYICTSPYTTNLTSVTHKMIWINEHLGSEWVPRTIITKDKTLIKGDYLIDDKPDITGANIPDWEQIIFTTDYNKHIPFNLRIRDWSQDTFNYLSALS